MLEKLVRNTEKDDIYYLVQPDTVISDPLKGALASELPKPLGFPLPRERVAMQRSQLVRGRQRAGRVLPRKLVIRAIELVIRRVESAIDVKLVVEMLLAGEMILLLTLKFDLLLLVLLLVVIEVLEALWFVLEGVHITINR